MGFFDKLFGRDYKYYLKKCDESIEMDDLGYATECIERARQLADPNDSDAKAEIDKKHSELKHFVYEKAFKQARTFFRGGQKEAAQNAIDRASRFVQNDEEREALNKLVEESHRLPTDEKIVEARVEGEEKITGLTSNDKWSMYVTQLPFAKAQHCDDLGDDFKEAWVALQEGQFDEAIEGLEAVYKAHSDDALVMCELGRAYYGKNQLEKADELLKKSDEAEPEIETKLLRTEVLWAMKRFDVAEEVLQAAHDADPENNNVLARIAQHGLISGDFQSGIDAVEVLAENLPRDFSVHRLAGQLYRANGEDEKALESFEKVNQIFWQVNPQTKQLTFDQNSAVAAANLYVKLNKKLERAAELLEAVRANTKGEAHVAICLQLAEVYEKMDKKSKRHEVLRESTRFLDDLLDTATGPERAMLNLQYADICEQLDDEEKQNDCIEEARLFFMKDAAAGHPVASFYLHLIENKRAGIPFPKADEMQDAMVKFVEEHRDELRAKAAAANGGNVPVSQPNMSVSQSAISTPQVSQKDADDIISRMASLVTKPVPKPSEDSSDSEEESDESEDSENSESSDIVIDDDKLHEMITETKPQTESSDPNDILLKMASMAPSIVTKAVVTKSEDNEAVSEDD